MVTIGDARATEARRRRRTLLIAVLCTVCLVPLTGCTGLPPEVARELAPSSLEEPDNFRLRNPR